MHPSELMLCSSTGLSRGDTGLSPNTSLARSLFLARALCLSVGGLASLTVPHAVGLLSQQQRRVVTVDN
jgi:hypothetical protein